MQKLDEKAAGYLGFELFGLHVKGMPTGKLFTISRKLLTMEEVIYPSQAVQQDHQKMQQTFKNMIKTMH